MKKTFINGMEFFNKNLNTFMGKVFAFKEVWRKYLLINVTSILQMKHFNYLMFALRVLSQMQSAFKYVVRFTISY